MSKRPTVAMQSDFRSSVCRVVSVMVEWHWFFRVECLWSSGWWYPLNASGFRVMSLGRVSRSGLWPYPRSISSSLAPEWIEVRVKRRVKLTLPLLLLWLAFISKWRLVVGTSASFQSPWSIQKLPTSFYNVTRQVMSLIWNLWCDRL